MMLETTEIGIGSSPVNTETTESTRPIRKRYYNKHDTTRKSSSYFVEVISVRTVNKVIKGGRKLRYSILNIVGDPSTRRVSVVHDKSKTYSGSKLKAEKLGRRKLKKYFLNVRIPEIKVKFKCTKLIVKPRKDDLLKVPDILLSMFKAVGFIELGIGMSIKIVGSVNPLTVSEAGLKLFEILDNIYNIYEKKVV